MLLTLQSIHLNTWRNFENLVFDFAPTHRGFCAGVRVWRKFENLVFDFAPGFLSEANT